MELSVHLLQGLHEFSFATSTGQAILGLCRPPIECRDIPPERVGLDGQYDHAGLSKRVVRLLTDHFGPFVVNEWRISQRGQVVVIVSKTGIADNLLDPIVDLTLQLKGAAAVEVNGVCQRRRSYARCAMR
jgi:hypothetical protein